MHRNWKHTLKSCEETLGDEGNSDYLTKLEPCKGKVLCSTIYSVWIVMINLKIKRKNLNPKSTLWWPGYGSFSVFDRRGCLVVKILWEHSFDRHFDSFNVSIIRASWLPYKNSKHKVVDIPFSVSICPYIRNVNDKQKHGYSIDM